MQLSVVPLLISSFIVAIFHWGCYVLVTVSAEHIDKTLSDHYEYSEAEEKKI